MMGAICHGSRACAMHREVAQAVRLYGFTRFISRMVRIALCSSTIPTACPGKAAALRAPHANPSGTDGNPAPDKLTSGSYFTTLSAHADLHTKTNHPENDRRDQS